ncbi:MAG: beta-L-arabinofuranosidase domain-containing protein [Candidatus Hydrogenedentales bacterium]
MNGLRFVVIATIAATSAFAADGESSSFPFAAVDPAHVNVGGEIGRRIDLTIQKNLLVIDVENQFLAPFRTKQSKLFDYIGMGKLIDAAVNFAYNTRDPKAVALKDHLVTELLATQLDDGYIGSFPEGARIRDVFDEHEIAYNIHALVNNYRRFHDQRSLDAARKLADYLMTNFKSATVGVDPQLVCKIDIERAMIALSEACGDARYRDYIVERVGLRDWKSPIDEVNNGKYSSADGHAYMFMNMCMAQADLYREHPDASLLTQSHRVIDYLTKDDGLMITGTCGLTERFRNNQETVGDVGESCATAYLIRLAHNLLQFEGNSLYGDLMERTIYNALFAAQSPDGRSLRYYTAIDGPRKYYPNDTYCCPGNWRRIVAELPEMIYYRSAGGGVLINLYAASTAEVPIAGGLTVKLRQETGYPNSGKVVIVVEPSQSAEFPVTLRIPRWCESATVAVNGQTASELAKPGDWYSVKRTWKSGDVVTLEMPMKTRLVRGRKLQAGKVAVMRGPLVFCFSPARQAARYPVYAGHGADPAEVQRSVAEAIGQTKIDWATLSEPVPDATIRPDGLALEVRGWGPASDRSKPADLKLVFSEFIDPTGEQTYWPIEDPKAGVDDELCMGNVVEKAVDSK